MRHQTIDDVVRGWPGVEADDHRFGGTEYRLGKREIGHIHDDMGLVDIPFPRRVRDELVAAGQAEPHHVLPDSGWVSKWLRTPEDVDEAIQLLERSYKLALDQAVRRAARRGRTATTG